MKKFTVVLLFCSLLLSFAACGEGENKALDSSSLSEQSLEESSSLQDASKSGYCSSEDFEETTPEEYKSEMKLSTRTSDLPQRAAVGYNTVYTKPSKLNAVSCNTATVYPKSEHSVAAEDFLFLSGFLCRGPQEAVRLLGVVFMRSNG